MRARPFALGAAGRRAAAGVWIAAFFDFFIGSPRAIIQVLRSFLQIPDSTVEVAESSFARSAQDGGMLMQDGEEREGKALVRGCNRAARCIGLFVSVVSLATISGP